MEKLQNYRQPVVTATGIFLGFMLNYAANWSQGAFTIHFIRDVIVAVSIVLCISLLMVVLFRILTMKYPPEQAVLYYQRTLNLFLIAIAIPFIGFVIIIIRRLLEGNTNTAID